jgi:hypothetical protein
VRESAPALRSKEFLPYDDTVLPNPGVYDLAFGDYNGDGFRDVLIAGNNDLLYQRGTP